MSCDAKGEVQDSGYLSAEVGKNGPMPMSADPRERTDMMNITLSLASHYTHYYGLAVFIELSVSQIVPFQQQASDACVVLYPACNV